MDGPLGKLSLYCIEINEGDAVSLSCEAIIEGNKYCQFVGKDIDGGDSMVLDGNAIDV